MSVSFGFRGKVILITGSSSGMGAATALLLSKSGAQVVVTGSNAERVSEVGKKCQKVSLNTKSVLEVVADVTKEDDLKRLVDSTIKTFGKLDVLVNNAGAAFYVTIGVPNYLDTVKRSYDLHLNSVLILTQLCVPYLEKTKGNIVNVSTVASFLASRKGSAYSMSKTALDKFTKCMAIELGPKGIRVNSVNPGGVRTQFIQRRGVSDSDAHKAWDYTGSKYPVGRAGIPEDIANAILLLVSDASSFTTGSIVLVDGGHIVM